MYILRAPYSFEAAYKILVSVMIGDISDPQRRVSAAKHVRFPASPRFFASVPFEAYLCLPPLFTNPSQDLHHFCTAFAGLFGAKRVSETLASCMNA